MTVFHMLRYAVGALLALALAVFAIGCNDAHGTMSAGTAALEDVERGRYLVSVLGCHDCHTPLKLGPQGPEPDMERALSGHPEGLELGAPPSLDAGWMWAGNATNTAFHGPWGVSYARNLTSDEETGIGFMNADLFAASLRSGKHFGAGRPVMPPMPVQAYRHLTDEDTRAVFAYLMTTKPIKNRAPESVPAQR